MTLLTLLLAWIIIEKIWSPRFEWIEESGMFLMHYNYKSSRRYFVLWK
jgi:hypothetical protein